MNIPPTKLAKSDGDLLAITKFKNALMYELIRNKFGSALAFSRASSCDWRMVTQYLNLKRSPFKTRPKYEHEYKESAEKIAFALNMLPEILFPSELYKVGARLDKGIHKKFQSHEVLSILEAQEHKLLPTEISPEDSWVQDENKKLIRQVLRTLTPREEKVIKMRFGFDAHEVSLEKLGTKLKGKPTRERVRQIEGNALAKLRQPARAHVLRPLINWQHRTRQPPSIGCVYVINAEGTNRYKIGLAEKKNNLEKRIQDIRMYSPFPIKVILSLDCLTSCIYMFETFLHQYFTAKCIQGEWFELDSADLEWIEKEAIGAFEVVPKEQKKSPIERLKLRAK